MLILDDFGEQSTTPWAQEKLYQLINYRYNARLPMVVTTCLSLDEIETRIRSRMVDPRISLVFNITAPDYRGNVKPTRQPSATELRFSTRIAHSSIPEGPHPLTDCYAQTVGNWQ